jgi:hypothetical protein
LLGTVHLTHLACTREAGRAEDNFPAPKGAACDAALINLLAAGYYK